MEPMGSDEIDTVVAQWRRERPDLDVSAMGVFGRFARVYALAGQVVEGVFARHGMLRGEFDVLAALRRSGAPYTLTPSVLAQALMLSRAGMTNRLDRLEAAGLVERHLDAADRRSFRIALTQRGLDLVDAAVADHAASEARLLGHLDVTEREALDCILRTLLRELEQPAPEV